MMSLSAEEFVRRFVQHVLPKGFVRIRHYGLLANRQRQEELALCRELLGDSRGGAGAMEEVEVPAGPESIAYDAGLPDCRRGPDGLDRGVPTDDVGRVDGRGRRGVRGGGQLVSGREGSAGVREAVVAVGGAESPRARGAGPRARGPGAKGAQGADAGGEKQVGDRGIGRRGGREPAGGDARGDSNTKG